MSAAGTLTYCGNCGDRVLDGARFCRRCGGSLTDEPVSPERAADPAPTKALTADLRGGRPGHPYAVTSPSRAVTGTYVILAGTVMALVAFFVPWLSLPVLGTTSGIQLAAARSDDAVLFALPAAAILLLLLSYARSVAGLQTSIWQALVGAAGGVCTVAVISNVMTQLSNLPFDLGALGRIEPGAWLALVGFLLAAIGGLMQHHEERTAEAVMYWYVASDGPAESGTVAPAPPSTSETTEVNERGPAGSPSYAWKRVDQ